MTHWFWLLLVVFTLGWYATITFLVAWRGFGDIREMLKNLSQDDPDPDEREKG